MHPLVCPLCRTALPTVHDVCPRDGRVGVEASWLPVPPTLSQRFRVLEPFAHGDTGSLYLADEPETGRRGLLKLLAPALKEQPSERQRLRRELVKQATLQRSQLIVPLASGESEGTTWLFREWLDGISLEVRLSRGGALQQTEALAVAAQVATALDELHRSGLLHRDVKPGHIFLQPTAHGIPRAFLLDAGVAAAIALPSGGNPQGSAGYLAPEQLLGGLVSFRSDLYSLGCVLYRMLTGQPAFPGETLDETLALQRRAEVPPIPATLPHGIGALLQSLLSKDPQERPFSAQKLRRTLDPFLPDGALMEKQPTSTFETVPQPRPSTAPQPSGTLRPPPPPSARPSPPTSQAGAPSTTGAGEPARAAPPTPPATKAAQERTQQLDIDQLELEEIAPPPKRVTSVPPPMPKHAGAAARKPTPVSDKTQPIRLEQILAVAATRKSAEPPPAAPEHTQLAQPALPPPAPVPAVAPGLSSLFDMNDLDAAAQENAAAHRGAPGHGAAGAVPAQEEPLADDDDPLDSEATVQRSLAEVEAASRAAPGRAPVRPAAKGTLMGLGQDNAGPAGEPSASNGNVSSDAAALSERQASSASVSIDTAALSERDHPTERISLAGGRDEGDRSRALTGSLPANTLDGVRADSRRLWMYASAALVGLSVLGVGASALMSGGNDVEAVASAAPPALPTAVTEEPAAEPAASALAEPPRPSVEQIEAAPSAEEPTDEAAESAAAAEEPVADEPSADEAVAQKPEAEPKRAKESSSSRRKSRERAEQAAKASQAEKRVDKASMFAEARDQARDHYAARRYKDAAASYERAAHFNPKDSGVFAGLGASRLAAGDKTGAVQAYQRAVKLAPKKSGFHAALGRAYLANGDRSRAVASYQRALSLDPGNGAAKAALEQLGV